ncbi:MAG: sulfite exporter TauE/SafE family protein [Nitrospirota bacterium]
MTLEIIILSSIVVSMAFFVRGLTGFGSGPLMVAPLILLLDIKIVVPTAAILAVLTGILLLSTFQTIKWVRKDVLLILIPTYMIGIVLGTYVLVSFKSSLLKTLLGLFIAGYALKILFWDKEVKEVKELKNYVGVIAGLLSGITGGLFGAGGPPVVVYLARKLRDKNALRATLVFLFFLMDIWRVILFAYAGLINVDILKFSLYLLPAFIIGNLSGSFVHIKVNQALFYRIIALVLLIIAIFLIF